MKLKGGAGQSKESFKVKQFVSKIEEYNAVLNLLRSSNLFEQFNSHNKCPVNNLCSFCLLRSLIYRVNSCKGRQTIVPVEVECQHGRQPKSLSKTTTLINILDRVITSSPDFKKAISPTWCSKPSLPEEEFLIHLNDEGENRNISHLLKMKLDYLLQKHNVKSSGKGMEKTKLIAGEDQTTCIFACFSMELDLQENLQMEGKLWKCVGAISSDRDSFFRVNDKWFKTSETVKEIEACHVKQITLAVYDRTDMVECQKSEMY